VSCRYDKNGNQTDRGSDDFTYDHEDQLIQSVVGGASSTSTYNGDGLRMSHTVGAATTNYTWDVGTSLPNILKDNTYTYVYGLDLVSATDSGGNQNYYMHNGNGSVANIMDYAGNEKASYYYEAFGLPTFTFENTSNYWRYTGEQRDSDSALYYLRARYYDPASGRFLSQDPIPTGNLYAYVGNNPVNLADPYGLFGCKLGPLGDPCGTATDVADTFVAGIKDWGGFIDNFFTLNCLNFALTTAGAISSVLAPQLAPEISLGLKLWWAGATMADKTLFAADLAINASQIKSKEGFSTGNLLNGAGMLASTSATIANTLNDIPALQGIGYPFIAMALATSAAQCYGDAF